MQRGSYVIASKDRKNPAEDDRNEQEEAGYDPRGLSSTHPLAIGREAELLVRIRATWTIAQLVFESHDPMVYPALDFFLGIAARMGPPLSARASSPIRSPSDTSFPRKSHCAAERFDPKVDVREHVDIREVRTPLRRPPTPTPSACKSSPFPEYEILNMLEEEPRQRRALPPNPLPKPSSWATSPSPATSSAHPGYLFEARDGGFRGSKLWARHPRLRTPPAHHQNPRRIPPSLARLRRRRAVTLGARTPRIRSAQVSRISIRLRRRLGGSEPQSPRVSSGATLYGLCV